MARPFLLAQLSDLHLGEPSGVAVNSKKHVFVFNRGNSTGPAYGATAAQVLEFDATGKFVMPGIIDSHAHLALDGDVNEATNPVVPHMMMRDAFDYTD